MTDPQLVAKKLAQIETCVTELRTLAHADALPHDIREQRFVQHTLQIAIQAAVRIGDQAPGPVVSAAAMGLPLEHSAVDSQTSTRRSRHIGFASAPGALVSRLCRPRIHHAVPR